MGNVRANWLQSKIFHGAVLGVAGVLALLVVFKAGMVVGVRKADFSCRWSDNYHRNFGGPRNGFLPGFGDRDFIDANGTAGQVIKIEGANIVIRGRDDVEKVVVVDRATAIKRFRDTVTIGDLKVNDMIVVIGEPNDAGQIEAKLIRVLPPPEMPPAGMPLR